MTCMTVLVYNLTETLTLAKTWIGFDRVRIVSRIESVTIRLGK